MMDGEGIFFWADGRKYNGSFASGQKSGYGELSHPNGNIFKGYWKLDVESGPGTLFLKSGEQLTGLWKNGCLISEIDELPSNDRISV
jgi:hypothetical protein